MPVVAGKALVSGEIGHGGAVVLVPQHSQVIARGGYIESAHASLLERRGGIICGAVKPGAQRRRSHGDIELVLGRDIKQPRCTGVRHEPLTGPCDTTRTISSSLRGAS